MIAENTVMMHIARALQNSGHARTDSAPTPFDGQRAMIKQFIDSLETAGKAAGRGPISKQRRADMIERMAAGLGWQHKAGQWAHRADAASHFAGELIDRGSEVIRAAATPTVLADTLPIRQVDPSAQLFQTRTVKYEGSANVRRPGQTSVPKANYRAGRLEGKLETLQIGIDTPWEAVAYGVASDVDAVSEGAEAANRALMQFLEDVLLNGLEGTDLKGLSDLVINHYTSAVNYDTGSIADCYADLVKWVDGIAEANADRGGRPNVAYIATDLARRLRKKSNLAAGGSFTGSELFVALAGGGDAQIGAAFRSAGISQLIEVPSLNGWKSSGRAGALAAQSSGEGQLRKVVSLMPSPVRTVETLAGTETLWIMRVGGLECPNATATGTMDAAV